jgi:hypothetical protein
MKSKEVVKLLRVNYARFYELLRSGKIRQPNKDCSGDYWWTMEDVKAAREALAVLDARHAAHAARRAMVTA